jgi:hypothetical protein
MYRLFQVYNGTTGGKVVVADQKIAGRNNAPLHLHSKQSRRQQEAVLADDFLLSIQRFTN